MKANHKIFKMDLIPRLSEAVVQRCSVKKVFLEISQSSQENNYVRVFFHIIIAILVTEPRSKFL